MMAHSDVRDAPWAVNIGCQRSLVEFAPTAILLGRRYAPLAGACRHQRVTVLVVDDMPSQPPPSHPASAASAHQPYVNGHATRGYSDGYAGVLGGISTRHVEHNDSRTMAHSTRFKAIISEGSESCHLVLSHFDFECRQMRAIGLTTPLERATKSTPSRSTELCCRFHIAERITRTVYFFATPTMQQYCKVGGSITYVASISQVQLVVNCSLLRSAGCWEVRVTPHGGCAGQGIVASSRSTIV